MIDFIVDENRCVRCGVCAGDCPVSIINLEHGFPHLEKDDEKKCMGCQHCLAVCPTGALSIFGINPDECVPASDVASSEQVDALIRNRRTVRQFKQKSVDPEKLNQLINTVANAPTRKNSRTVTLHVIDDIDQMKVYVEKAYSHLEQMIEAGTIPENMGFFHVATKMYREGKDLVFRSAPAIVVASAPKDGPTPMADAYISLSYMELMASSMGLGAVWCGFAMYMFSFAPELMSELGIPEDHEVAYTLLLGEPSVKYFRGVVRDDIQVNRVTFTNQ